MDLSTSVICESVSWNFKSVSLSAVTNHCTLDLSMSPPIHSPATNRSPLQLNSLLIPTSLLAPLSSFAES